MNITFDHDNPSDGAALRFSILRIGNYWIEGHTQSVTLRLKPTETFWNLFNFLRERAIEQHRGPVTVELGGKDVILEPSLWQSMIDCMFEWEDSLNVDISEALETFEDF